MQPAAFPPTVCDLWGGPQGIRRAILSQLFPPISLVNCTAHASESLWIVMLPLLPPSWFAGLSASIRTGKLFPMISFSPMVPVSGRFLGWFPLLGLPWIPPFSIWHLAPVPKVTYLLVPCHSRNLTVEESIEKFVVQVWCLNWLLCF